LMVELITDYTGGYLVPVDVVDKPVF